MRRRTFLSSVAASAAFAWIAKGDIPRSAVITDDRLRFLVRVNGKTGYIDDQGMLIIPARYAWGGVFSEGIALVVGDDKRFRYINSSGEKLFDSPFTHDHRPFSGGFAEGSIDLEFRFIDHRGKLLRPYFAGSHAFSDGMAAVCINPARFAPRQPGDEFRWEPGKWGFINPAGDLVILADYWGVGDFVNGLAPVYVGGESIMCTGLAGGAWGYINKRGSLVIAPQFQSAANFSEGLAAVTWKDQGTGYIDRQGKVVIPPRKLTIATSFHDGVARIRGSQELGKPGWKDFGYVNKTGEIFIHENFSFGVEDFSEGLASCGEKPTWNGREWDQGLHGYVNKQAEWIVKPQFTHTAKFSSGIARVEKDEAVGYIDKTGRFVWPLTK